MEEDISQRIQSLGVSGYTRPCLYAIEAILDSNSLPDKATIVTYVKGRQGLQQNHLFVFWNWCSIPITVVRSGFASGYSGEAPRGFSLAICMIRSKNIPIEGIYMNKQDFEHLDDGTVNPAIYQRLKVKSEPLTWPWPLWVQEEHEQLLEEERLWDNLEWHRTNPDIDEAINAINDYHPLVARKLRLAVRQLKESTEIEEWQQIGILIRDSWIEFAQKLFAEIRVANGPNIGADDVKAMMRVTIKEDETYRLVCAVYDLALKVQHDRSVFNATAKWCTNMTILSMAVVLIASNKKKKSELTYYKCPLCGSVKLTKVTKGVPDFDGHPVPMTFTECSKCGWSIPEV